MSTLRFTVMIPPGPCNERVSHTGHRRKISPSHFLDLTVSLLLTVEINQIKSRSIPGAFVPRAASCGALLVTSIIPMLTYLSKHA